MQGHSVATPDVLFYCVPGMFNNLEVSVLYTLDSEKC